MSNAMKSRSILLLSYLLFFAGCSVGPGYGYYGPSRLDVPFWQAEPRPVGIVLRDVPTGSIYRDGGDDLYHDIVSDRRDKALIRLLESTSTDFEWLVDEFTALFSERGFPVMRVDESPRIPTPESTEGLGLRALLTAISEGPSWDTISPEVTEDVDILLVISPVWWGIRRDYVGVFPVSRHHAGFQVDVELFDLRNRMILWSATGSAHTALDYRWKEPPDYPGVFAALEKAHEDAGMSVVARLAKWKGKRAELVFFGKKPIDGR
jgi:hypothetical protein